MRALLVCPKDLEVSKLNLGPLKNMHVILLGPRKKLEQDGKGQKVGKQTSPVSFLDPPHPKSQGNMVSTPVGRTWLDTELSRGKQPRCA